MLVSCIEPSFLMKKFETAKNVGSTTLVKGLRQYFQNEGMATQLWTGGVNHN